jgi:hypothetical protein
MSVRQTEYTKWFRRYADRFGIRSSEGKLGRLFCAAFDVDDPQIKNEQDDRAAVILIHGHVESDLTVEP